MRLRLRGAALDRTAWVQARAKAITSPCADGWADAELTLEDEDNALTVIRVLGDDTIVLEPEHLRHRAVASAQAFVAANLGAQTPGARTPSPSSRATSASSCARVGFTSIGKPTPRLRRQAGYAAILCQGRSSTASTGR